MSEDLAISVSNVTKAYGLWDSPEARLKDVLRHLLGRKNAPDQTRRFHALQNIYLNVPKGQSLGIIGLNGSGKSTLLQIIAGTLQPSSGVVNVRGRLAALLELGSGFNPDFTGRENIFLNAMVLGLTREETAAKLDAIIAFADIGEFVDQPVKTYSSGMNVRLAFAVLSQIEPEILIIDEALSVGDFLFQQKCFDCIREFRRKGCTFLFVSHGMGTVLELCDHAIVLDRGRMIFQGTPKDAVDLYEANALRTRFGIKGKPGRNFVPNHAPNPETEAANSPTRAAEPDEPTITSQSVSLESVRILDAAGADKELVTSGQEIQIQIKFRFHQSVLDPHIGFKIRNQLGVVMYETNTYCLHQFAGVATTGTVITAQFKMQLTLIDGEYSITAAVANGGKGRANFAEALHFQHDSCYFVVIRDWARPHWAGLVDLQAEVQLGNQRA